MAHCANWTSRSHAVTRNNGVVHPASGAGTARIKVIHTDNQLQAGQFDKAAYIG